MALNRLPFAVCFLFGALLACGCSRGGLDPNPDVDVDLAKTQPTLRGAFVTGAVVTTGALKLSGQIYWHAAVSGTRDGITLKGGLR